MNPSHGEIWTAILDAGASEDLMMDVLERVQRRPLLLQSFNMIVKEIGPLGIGSAGFYAERVQQEARRRRLLTAAHQALALVENGESEGLENVLRAHWDDALAAPRGSDEEVPGLYELPDFLRLDTSSTYDWVIPGFLEHQERVILVAPVKTGKSVLTRQMAICVAAGRHPFDPRREIPKKKVLMIDLENPTGVLKRDLKRQAIGMGAVEGLWVLHQPAGMDLGDPKVRRTIERAIEKSQADLVCIGPLYKAYDGLDETWEKQAAGVQRPIDRWRSDFNCAFWIEHHASKSDPTGLFGSSRWARWFDMKVALIPEDPASPPPHQRLEWSATYRDSRRIRPELIEISEVKGLGDVSWSARFTGNDPFELQLDQACSD